MYVIYMQFVCFQGVMMRRSNKDRTEATRTALIDAARALFVEKGYGETSTPDIVAKAEVTRGALYHHFMDKKALFQAVVEAEARHVADEIAADTDNIEDPLDALVKGTEVYFEAMRHPGRARLLLLEGTVVLGRTEMDRIDKWAGAQELLNGLAYSAERNNINDLPLEPLAEILSAALDRAALSISEGANPEPYLRAAKSLIGGLFK